MRPEYVRLIWLQGAITAVGVVFAGWFVTLAAAGSFMYGGCAALASTLYLAWRFGRGARKENLQADWVLRHAYRTVIERFALAAAVLAVGFKVLQLAPLGLLAGFVGGQAAWLLVPVWMKIEKIK